MKKNKNGSAAPTNGIGVLIPSVPIFRVGWAVALYESEVSYTYHLSISYYSKDITKLAYTSQVTYTSCYSNKHAKKKGHGEEPTHD